jgi:AAA ATPase domain/Protein kinase domain
MDPLLLSSPPFAQIGPIEWQCHGLQARVVTPTNHGNERYWATYCPVNGITFLSERPFADEILDGSKTPELRHANDILQRLHAPEVLSGVTVPWHWQDSPPALLTRYNNDRPLVPKEPQVVGSVEQFLDFAIKLTKNLRGLHSKTVRHGALRPESISTSVDGGVWINDFTSASFIADDDITNETCADSDSEYFHYASPECRGRIIRPVDYRSDLYSLGATLFHIITGQPLWTSHINDEANPFNDLIAQAPPSTNFHPLIDATIAKLLSSLPELRYQTCDGLLSDWEDIKSDPYTPFTVGQTDDASTFRIPPGLYGRDSQQKQLYELYEKARDQRLSSVVFVKGDAGIGKTALVREFAGGLHSAPRTIFCQGKFDQHKNVPFSAIVQAFRDLARQLLSESTSSLERWRTAIRDAIEGDVAVLLPLVPDLAHVLGMDSLARLPCLENPICQGARQNLVIMQFLQVIAQRRTLVIFLDDVQWSSKSDGQLLRTLVQGFPRTGAKTGNASSFFTLDSTLLICAYRDNLVDEQHHIRTDLEDQVRSEAISIVIEPLMPEHASRFVSDLLNRPSAECKEFTKLLYSRTHGNPFFMQRVSLRYIETDTDVIITQFFAAPQL